MRGASNNMLKYYFSILGGGVIFKSAVRKEYLNIHTRTWVKMPAAILKHLCTSLASSIVGLQNKYHLLDTEHHYNILQSLPFNLRPFQIGKFPKMGTPGEKSVDSRALIWPLKKKTLDIFLCVVI